MVERKVGERIAILFGIVWSLVVVYFIFTRYDDSRFYLFISEFAVIFSIFILSSLLLGVRDRRSFIRFFVSTIILVVMFGIPIYWLSGSFLVIGYLGLSVVFNLVNFYFVDVQRKFNLFKIQLKNMIFLVLAGVFGLGVFAIIVYHLIKIIEKVFQFFGIELIEFGKKG